MVKAKVMDNAAIGFNTALISVELFHWNGWI
jgi:hypothetical protein